MSDSKNSMQPLDWQTEQSFSSQHIPTAQTVYVSSSFNQPSSLSPEGSQFSCRQVIITSSVEMPPTQTSIISTQRVPLPMSDLQPLASEGLIQQPSQYHGEQEPAYQSFPPDYSYDQPSTSYQMESFHELSPQVEKGVLACFPPTVLSTTVTDVTSYTSSPHTSEFFTPEVSRSPTTAASPSRRRGRRSRGSNRYPSPYSRTPGLSSGKYPRGRPRRVRIRRASSSHLLDKYQEKVPECFPEEFFHQPEEPGADYDKRKVYAEIIEQPQQKALRFRYICEGRSAGSIPGVHSIPESKSYPTIKIMNYQGPAMVMVSCVTVEPPHRPHPHNLVGKDGCEGGVCSLMINNEKMECSFSNLGIQCVKRRDIEKSLIKREERGVDPFATGFSHRHQPQTIDLNSVRLCFQVYLKDRKTNELFALVPVVSDPIYDKKATSDLMIAKLSDCSSNVLGGRDIILLCDKVVKDDIRVRFYELEGTSTVWEAFGEFQSSDVYKQVAISFRTPKYRNVEIRNPVKVYVQLLRPSDNSTSESRTFYYYPIERDSIRGVQPEIIGESPSEEFKRDELLDLDSQHLVQLMPPFHDLGPISVTVPKEEGHIESLLEVIRSDAIESLGKEDSSNGSSNSDSVNKLKIDLETLDKLSR